MGDLYALRKLLRHFRRTQHTPPGTLAADKGELDGIGVGKDEWAAWVLRRMIEKSLVTYDGKAYYVDTRALSARVSTLLMFMYST